MPMRLYNTLTRQEEEFTPLRDDTVRMYTCGLTVYARGHIGNFRTFVCIDVLRRALKYVGGWRMRHVVNFTDVDDKTIAGAQREGLSLREYTDRYIAAFYEDADALGIEKVEETPRATDPANLDAMASMIKALEQGGHTYVSDGSIYFKIATMPTYGRLARLDHDGMQAGARVDADSYDKEDARDFVLWKATKPGEPSWDVGVGPGRPGWHIECSAMALRLLGDAPIDIHTGGIDLIFPHHENEIAQSECATGQPFSRFWVHAEHLLVDDKKMSKSLGNVYTLKDIVERGFRVSALRYLLLSSHYRKQLNFTWAGLQQAEESLTRLTDCLARLDALPAGERACGADRGDSAARTGVRRGARERPEYVCRAGRDVRSGARRQHRHRRPGDERRRRGGCPCSLRPFRRCPRFPVASARRRRTSAGSGGRDRVAHRRAQGRTQPSRLRGSRSHPPGSGRPRHHPRGQSSGHSVEAEDRTSSVLLVNAS